MSVPAQTKALRASYAGISTLNCLKNRQKPVLERTAGLPAQRYENQQRVWRYDRHEHNGRGSTLQQQQGLCEASRSKHY